jgi:hypothetical protein
LEQETFPDIGAMSNEELKNLISELSEQEREISYRRRVLHGKIDILRAELVGRLRDRGKRGGEIVTGDDLQQLVEILAGKPPSAES